jgi:hypothetical protein
MQYILLVIIIGLVLERFYTLREFQKERAIFIDKMFALKERENIPIDMTPTKEEDLTPIEDVLDDKFMKAIQNEQGN